MADSSRRRFLQGLGFGLLGGASTAQAEQKAVGVVGPGFTNVNELEVTYEGDAKGTSHVVGQRVIINSIGPRKSAQAIAGNFMGRTTGTGEVTTLRGVHGEARMDGPGWVNSAHAVTGAFSMTGTGNVITNIQYFRAASPEITGTGKIPSIEAYRASNMGHKNVTGDVMGFRARDQDGNAGKKFGFYSEVTAGKDKFNFFAAGDAPNFFMGQMYFGQHAAPRAEKFSGYVTIMDVTGTPRKLMVCS